VSYWPYIIAAASVLLAVLRFTVKSHDAIFDATNLLKTAAHFFLGGLLGVAISQRTWLPMIPFAILTLIEIVAFLRSGANIKFSR